MQGLRIVGLGVLAAVVYGILHDNVTVRVCAEYFTVFHPDLFRTDNPWVLALGWGVLATFWMGGILGAALAGAARLGRRPKLTWRELVRPVGLLLALTGMASLAVGVLAFSSASARGWGPPAHMASRIPIEKHAAFVGVLAAHNTAYFAGFVGGVALCVWTYRKRGRAIGAT
jgi:hypothetical protein